MLKLNMKLKVQQRLALGFGLLVAFLVAVAVVGLVGLNTNNQITETITTKDWKKTVIANDIVDLANANGRLNLATVITRDKGLRDKLYEQIETNKKAIDGKVSELDGLLYKEKGKVLLAAMKEARAPYVAQFGNISKLVEAGRYEEASQTATDDLIPLLNGFIKSIDALIVFQGELVDAGAAEARANYVTERNVLIGAALAALVMGGLLAFFTSRHITRATGQLGDTVAKVADGDYTARSA